MTNPTDQTIVHVCSPASPPGEDLPVLGIGGWPDLVAGIQREIGPGWQITGCPDLIWTRLQPRCGGRTDDGARAQDLQRAFADEGIRAIVALRGGAWLLRILERIDFSVLSRRRKPLLLMGFSEWTCLSLVAGRFPAVLSIHHTTPCYMVAPESPEPLSPEQKQCRWRQVWASARALLEGGAPAYVLSGRLVMPTPLPAGPVRLYGGNLTLLTSLVGTKYHDAVRPDGAWLAIEDINESIGSIDRKITQLRLAGLLDGLGGVLLGGFHTEGRNISRDVGALLAMHLPASVPVVAECNFGHFWPAAPFPLWRPVQLVASPAPGDDAGCRVEIRIDWPALLR